MANKEKKRKDKKRKQRRERKGKLPSSVEALLGYLGGGGPSPAPQGDTKLRERAGVDAYDTLHQIIKSQQMMSANYMANLERMAFKTEITEQLKKQGEESKKVLNEATLATKAEVEKIARNYVKKSPEDKIAEYQSQIEWHMRRGDKGSAETIAAAEKGIKKYQGILEFRQSSMPPAVGVAPSLLSPSVKAGEAATVSVGGGGGVKVSIASAQGTSELPAVDPNLRFIATRMGTLSPAPRTSKTQEIEGGLGAFQNFDLQVSSGDLPNLVQMSREERQQNKQIKRLESELIREGALGGGLATRRMVKK